MHERRWGNKKETLLKYAESAVRMLRVGWAVPGCSGGCGSRGGGSHRAGSPGRSPSPSARPHTGRSHCPPRWAGRSTSPSRHHRACPAAFPARCRCILKQGGFCHIKNGCNPGFTQSQVHRSTLQPPKDKLFCLSLHIQAQHEGPAHTRRGTGEGSVALHMPQTPLSCAFYQTYTRDRPKTEQGGL